MNQKISHGIALPPLLTHAAVCHAAAMLVFFPRQTNPDHSGMLVWWLCLTLAYAALTVYLRRPRPMRGVLCIAAACYGLQLLIHLRIGAVPHTKLGLLGLPLLWGWSYYRCCTSLLNGVSPEALLSAFETTVVMLPLTAVCSKWEVMGSGCLLHLTIGMVLALAALARLRRGHRRLESHGHNSGIGLLTALLLMTGGCGAAFALLLSGSTTQLLTRLTAWALSLLQQTVDAVGRVIYWLLSLLPQFERDGIPSEDEATADIIAPMQEEILRETDIVIVLLVIAAVAMGIWLLVRLWKHRSPYGITLAVGAARQVQRNSRSLAEILGQLVHRIRATLHRQWLYLHSRSTPVGLLIWLERRMALRRKPRRLGETSRMFLLRTADLLPDCTEELHRLADCLDRHYFGSGDSLTLQEVTAMRRKLRCSLAHRSPSRQ